MNIFSTLPVGDSATWLDSPVPLPDGRTADAASGWALAYNLRGPGQLDITATAAGTSWSTTLTASASAALVAGAYSWAAVLTKGGERITAGRGSLTLTPNLAAVSAPYDGRSVAKKALDDCEAALATFRGTGGRVNEYEIAGRRLKFATIGELIQLRNMWSTRVLTEGTAQASANGQANPRNLYTRFVRPQ